MFSLFFTKKCEIPYSSNVETSVGNNSHSVKDRAVKFAYSRGRVSAMPDRMVWLLSLLCAWKWPRPLI